MPKYCPACGLAYSDTAMYCDQEGEELVFKESPAAPRRRYALWKILLPVIVLLVIALFGGFFYLKSQVHNHINLTFQSFSIPQQGGGNSGETPGIIDRAVGVVRSVTGTGDIIAQVKVRNDTPWQGNLLAADYLIYLNDKEIGRGQWKAPNGSVVVIRGGEDISLNLPVQLQPGAGISGGIDTLLGKEPAIRMEGKMSLSVTFFEFEVPFKLSKLEVEPTTKQPTY